MARIAIGGFQAEINSFFPAKTAYADFVDIAGRAYASRVVSLMEGLRGKNWGISGFADEMAKLGHDLWPTTWAIAQPAAELTTDAFDSICGDLVRGIAAAGPIDAVYLCLHGAMIAEGYEDAESEILRRVRAVAGDVPIVATLDLHANVTAEMVELATALIVYRTYPHIDMADCGRKAAQLLHEVLCSGRRPAKIFRKLPFLIPPVWQCTTIEPAKSIFATLEALEVSPVVSLSFAEGFPASDIRDCGPAVIAYAQDRATAEAAAERLYGRILDREADFAGTVYTPDAAIAAAEQLYEGRPIVFADTQDNPGSGGSSNTVGILVALLKHNIREAALGIFFDPEAAKAAHAAGIGAELDLELGSKLASGGEPPVRGRFIVEALSDGDVACKGPMLGGQTLRLGETALLRIEGVRVVVASVRIQPYDREVFVHLGLDPASQRILSLKSSVHFRNDFQDIAGAVLVVDSPGFNATDHRQFPYRHLRPDVRIAPLGPTFHEWIAARG